jgi:hypothetical protein
VLEELSVKTEFSFLGNFTWREKYQALLLHIEGTEMNTTIKGTKRLIN